MKKKPFIVTCLLLLSIVVAGKLHVSLNPDMQEDSYVAFNIEDETHEMMTPPKTDILLKSSAWLMSELIPSAEAAKSIMLDEERLAAESVNAIDIQQQRLRLEDKEKALDEREQEVEDAEARAAKKIAALEALHVRIQAMLVEEESIKDKKIKRLTSVYEGMKAERAAPVIAQMDLTIVVKMFLRMNEKQVGKILSFLPPKQAVVISQALTQRIALVSN
ncbi:MAG TPA: hypothetical protein EYG66_08715 [Mariprofundaceae bacterium]|nr:hypothetical protein [Mariprofundaceae bacterium]